MLTADTVYLDSELSAASLVISRPRCVSSQGALVLSNLVLVVNTMPMIVINMMLIVNTFDLHSELGDQLAGENAPVARHSTLSVLVYPT